MSAAVSGLDRMSESTSALREADPAAEKSTAFEVLLDGVLNDAQEREPQENQYDDSAMREQSQSDRPAAQAAEKETDSVQDKKTTALSESVVSIYAYESAQPVFSANEAVSAAERRGDYGAEKASAGETDASQKAAEKAASDEAGETRTEERGEAKETREDDATEKSDGAEGEESAEEAAEETDDIVDEGAEEPEAEALKEPVAEVEEAPAGEGDADADADADAALQPVAGEEEAGGAEEEGAVADEEEAGPVDASARMEADEDPMGDEQEHSAEQNGQEGTARAAETAAPVSSLHASGSEQVSNEFLASLMQQAEAPAAVSGGETLARIEQIQQLADRFDQHILSMIRRSDQDMTITISPESLGKLVVHCREEADGVRVHVQAEQASVCNLLQQQESGIRQSLNQNGYKLAEFEVSTENGESAEQRRGRTMNEREEQERDEQGGKAAHAGGREAAPARRTVQRLDRNGVWLIA